MFISMIPSMEASLILCILVGNGGNGPYIFSRDVFIERIPTPNSRGYRLCTSQPIASILSSNSMMSVNSEIVPYRQRTIPRVMNSVGTIVNYATDALRDIVSYCPISFCSDMEYL